MPTEDDKESPIGRSFYSCYQVDNKTDLENKLNEIDGLEYKWMPDGCLQVITEPIPAIRMIEQQHNHGVYQWTFHNSVIAAFVGWQDCRNDRLKSVCFGNDEEMDLNVLQSIFNFSECCVVSIVRHRLKRPHVCVSSVASFKWRKTKSPTNGRKVTFLL